MLNNAPNIVEMREKCPGSARLNEGQPKEPGTPEKDRGLRLHAAIDDVLTGRTNWQVATLGHGITDAFDVETVKTAERVFNNEIKKLEEELDAEAGEIHAETVVNLAPAGWPGLARLDFVVVFKDVAGAIVAVLVVELKTGFVQVTGPEANRQLHDYLVGAAGLYPQAQRLYGAILQPAIVAELQWRLGRWTRTEVLEGFGPVEGPNTAGLAMQLQTIRAATHDPAARLVWGDHCGTCGLRQMCPARRGAVEDARAILAESGTTVAAYMAKLTPAERLATWKTAKQARTYLDKFDELVKAWIMDDPTNNTVPGYRVGKRPGNREFDRQLAAPQVAAKAWELAGEELAAAGIPGPEALLEVIGPKKVEDLLPEAAFQRLQAAGLIVKPEGSLSVLEDKAPAIPKPRKK